MVSLKQIVLYQNWIKFVYKIKSNKKEHTKITEKMVSFLHYQANNLINENTKKDKIFTNKPDGNK